MKEVAQVLLTLAKLLTNLGLRKVLLHDRRFDQVQVFRQQRSAHQSEVLGADQKNLVKLDPLPGLGPNIVVDHQDVARGDLVLVPAEHDDGEQPAVAAGLNLVVDQVQDFLGLLQIFSGHFGVLLGDGLLRSAP